MNFTELFQHIHKGSCTYVFSVLRTWVSEQASLHCTAQAVVEPRISDQVSKVHFDFTTFFLPTDSESQISANGLYVLNLDELNGLATDIEKADFVHDQLNEIQIQAQESCLNAAICRQELTSTETEVYNTWVSKPRNQRKPLTASKANPHFKSIVHSAEVGVLLRSYLDEFFTSYTAP